MQKNPKQQNQQIQKAQMDDNNQKNHNTEKEG